MTNQIEQNQETDFNLCKSNEEAIKSKAWRLWLITVLKLVYSNKEASKYVELWDWLFNKTIDLDELLELEKVFSNIEVIGRGEEYINSNIIVLESVEKHNITMQNIAIYINNLIVQQKVSHIIWIQCEWILEEILNNEIFLIYKQDNVFILFNKKTEEKTEYDKIIKAEYWYYIKKLNKWWVLDNAWEEIIPCEYDKIIKAEYWYYIKKLNKWWVLYNAWEEIIPCEYDFIVKEKYWYRVMKWDKRWMLDDIWQEIIPCEYDFIIIKKYWYIVIKWDKWWVLDDNWEEIIPCEYNEIIKEEYWYRIIKWNKWWVLDDNWEELIPCEYNEITKEEYWYDVKKWNKWWVLDNAWEEIIPCEYDKIIKKGYWYYIKKWNKWWVLDDNWEELIPCEYDFVDIFYKNGDLYIRRWWKNKKIDLKK
jgi:hypothetical protein